MSFQLPSIADAKLLHRAIFMMRLDNPETLDQILAQGFRILAMSFLRDPFAYGSNAINLPLRIRLEGFTFAKSQRQLLKKNDKKYDKTIKIADWNVERTSLFMQHRIERIGKDGSPYDFLPIQIEDTPTKCVEFDFFEKNDPHKKLVCASYTHLGKKAFSSTVCFYDTALKADSLGHYSMLHEICYAKEQGFDYFYLGNVQSKPSIFDYKLNFHNLEVFCWTTKQWYPTPRVPVTDWRNYAHQEHIETANWVQRLMSIEV
jgi:leucyl-tRNA---protein transferase